MAGGKGAGFSDIRAALLRGNAGATGPAQAARPPAKSAAPFKAQPDAHAPVAPPVPVQQPTAPQAQAGPAVASPAPTNARVTVNAPINPNKSFVVFSEIGADGSAFAEIEVHGEDYARGDSVIKIGKFASSHVHIDDPSVSRMHAVIELSENDYKIIDLGSTRGTFINGERVTKGPLKEGDTLKFGDVELKVTRIAYDSGERTPEPAPVPVRAPVPMAILPPQAQAQPPADGAPGPAKAQSGQRAAAPLNANRVLIVLSEVVPEGSAGRMFAGSKELDSQGRAAIMIGTLEGSDVRVDAETVSRKHAVINASADGCEIVDLGAQHGTFVNGERIAKCWLDEDDTIALGDVKLKVTRMMRAAAPIAKLVQTSAEQQLLLHAALDRELQVKSSLDAADRQVKRARTAVLISFALCLATDVAGGIVCYRMHKINKAYAEHDAVTERWADYYFRQCRPGSKVPGCANEMMRNPKFESGEEYELAGKYAIAGVAYALRGNVLDANRMKNKCMERHDLAGAQRIADTVMDIAEALHKSVPAK